MGILGNYEQNELRKFLSHKFFQNHWNLPIEHGAHAPRVYPKRMEPRSHIGLHQENISCIVPF